MICVATISKQHFYDLWAQLEDYLVLRSQNPDEDVLKLLNLVIKIQIRRRIKRAQFKEFATKLYSNIKNAWMLANSEILDKIMLKLMTVIQDSESVIAFLLKAKALVNNPDCEILLKDLLKGINLIDASFPDLLIGQVLAEYIEINCVILSIVKPADNPDKAALLRQSCFNLKEMMISNPHAQIILKDKSE